MFFLTDALTSPPTFDSFTLSAFTLLAAIVALFVVMRRHLHRK